MQSQIPSLLLVIATLGVPAYTLYLLTFDPWSELKKKRKLHEMTGDEWMKTEQGGMAIDDDAWRIYLYKIDD